MSWSDDMRCLYCDGKLPLYRKITHGQFCSTSHRKAYWQEQERLAVERLHQTHNSLKANQPPAPVASILGRDPGDAELSGFVPSELYPQSQGARRMLVADPLAYDFERIPCEPAWVLPEPPAKDAPSAGPVRAFRGWSKRIANNHVRAPRGFEFAPKIVPLQALRPCLQMPLLDWPASLPTVTIESAIMPEPAAMPEPATAGLVGIALSVIAPPVCTISPQPFPSRMPRPTQRVDLPIAVLRPEIEVSKKEFSAKPGRGKQPPAVQPLLSLTNIFKPTAEHALPVEAARQLSGTEPLDGSPLTARFPDRRVILAVSLPQPAGAVALAGVPAAPPPYIAAESVPKPLQMALTLPQHQAARTAGIRKTAGAVNFVAAVAKLPEHAAAESTPELMQAALTLPDHRVVKAVEPPEMAGSVALPGLNAVPAALTTKGNVRSLASAVKMPLQSVLSLRSRQPRLAMGKGSRYPIELRANAILSANADPMAFPPPSADAALSAQLSSVPLATEPSPFDALVPEMRGLVSLNVSFGPPPTRPVPPVLSNIATIPQPLRTEPIRPVSRLQPLDAKPFADVINPDVVGAEGSGSALGKMNPWNRAAGFWKLAPRDLKILAFAIPALLALAFHRELPKVHLAANPPSTGELSKNLRTVASTQFTNMRKAVVDRAAVALDEDFRSGLDDWASRSDATADWSFDATGFVKPGPLALYRPSMNLADYQVQFLGMIDKKAMSWVVRAADFDNYYVLKLVVLKPGPRTTVGLTRYAVINGKAVDRVDTVVPIEAQADTLYRVNLQLAGDDFSLGIQGQMIDNWSEPRLPRGGVGFFTARGEESRIRWVALTHQYDMLGRLCAYLAPYETPTTNGSW